MHLSAGFRHFPSARKLCNVPKLNHYLSLRRRRWAFGGPHAPDLPSWGQQGRLPACLSSPPLWTSPSTLLFLQEGERVPTLLLWQPPGFRVPSAPRLGASKTHSFVQERDKP